MGVNSQLALTLDDAVVEVLGILTGMDLHYDPELDRYQSITRQLNRAMRACAVEKEWSWYYTVLNLGTRTPGERTLIYSDGERRVRVINDDAVRLVDPETGAPKEWAYYLPRDAIHKYYNRRGLWVAATRNVLEFSRPLNSAEAALEVHVPVMREPVMFRLPEQSEDPMDPVVEVPQEVRDQEIDFPYPDLVVLRAAFYVAQSDPVMQPRVQTIEAQYKDMLYQILERDDRNTDSPYQNEFMVPVAGSLNDVAAFGGGWWNRHPHADERR